MTIEALALLQGSAVQSAAGGAPRKQPLEDGVLLSTGAPFESDPAALTARVRELVGEALEQHRDSRGIFFVPSVAPVTATRYEEVIAEIGEGGMWGPSPGAGADPFSGELGAMLGGMLAQLPPGLLEAVSGAAASGDLQGLQRAGAQLEALLGGSAELERVAAQLQQALPDLAARAALTQPPIQTAQLEQLFASFGLDPSNLDLSSPRVQELVAQLQSPNADPAALSELAARLFGKS